MSARVIDGRAIAAAVRERVRAEVAAYEAEAGRVPTLATVIVGEDPASGIYVRNKHRACEEVGMRSVHHGLAGSTSEAELLELVAALGRDGDVDGILVQLPVPDQIDPDTVVGEIDPGKDVDGLTPLNAGLLAHGTPGLVPCTPAGVMEMLRHEGVDLEGAEAVVVGRSKLVGVPVARLLLAADATVTICHSRTADLAATCARADVLVAAVGVPRLLGGDAIKPGAVVIDVGMNRTEDGLCGDVDFDAASEIAAAISPVPGGVGPMTIAMLLVNTLQAARARWLPQPAA
ncbi:MAG TPA: bifunctional methylenetetrahydrofolate dehydrogenase/methenyltetrahydrofolate cyclohydrolase FolD [Solirubrobacterales bacterium]|nr:bifunctional methylenetetrahydrofolate dehydrogenase/methenyltetrahydrofolate cyclohydrolase FolD [Solirubrobacterales bacterium]